MAKKILLLVSWKGSYILLVVEDDVFKDTTQLGEDPVFLKVGRFQENRKGKQVEISTEENDEEENYRLEMVNLTGEVDGGDA
ncbi:hypothetical protein Hamer_G005661 [Homarus americanus]|uniref:Uncharacterized protein n=1 Tax=Homarus americanus TaxID=6706 RepID=A0A8J5K3S7_HOMAM|nr:hypothetical protein Hamer_G005661 [Homarus americanus]